MEHGASERVKEQSHTAMPVKTEVDKAAQSTAYRGVQTNLNYTEEEPGLVELVKSEPALLVKEEVVEDEWQDIAEQQCVHGPLLADPGNTLNIKEELGAIVGPTVLQPMDTPGTTNQKDVGFVKQERTINHDKSDPILCGGVKEETIEDKWRVQTGAGLVLPAGSPTPQDSLMEQPGACTALHSLHKECLETVCRVQLIRLDTFQCQVCDAAYIDSHKLLQHVQDVHGPRPRGSLRQHVKSPQISKEGQQCATADTDAQRSNKAAQSELRARSPLHSCEECMITYAHIRSLVAHYRNVHSTEAQKCTKCNKKFPKAYLSQHTTDAHSEQQHECAVCKKTYRSKQSLYNHVYNVHRLRPAVPSPVVYTCDYCLKTYTTKLGLVQHIDVVHTKVRYTCSECNKEYKGKYLLQRHIRKIHSKEEHEADTDDRRSNKGSQSKQRAPSQLYGCDECGKTYASKHSLMAHYRNLHSTESHKCTKCDRNFPSKAYLRKHIRYVHSEQLYKCTVCKKICRSKAALNTHVYRLHRPRPAADTDDQRSNKASQSKQRTPSQLYGCDKCMKTYASKYTLLAHIENLHSTESHKCTKCNKIFPSKAYLYQHTRLVHSEQRNECAVCKKTYRSQMALYKHVYYAHQPRPAESHQLYICTNCGKDFNSKLSCWRHKKRGKCRRPTVSSTSAAASTSPTASNSSAVASTSRQQPNVDVVKEEPADGELELGPVVFQHMDCNYRPYKQEPQLD